MDSKIVNQILDQAPNETTAEQVTTLYEKYEGNVVDILAELWQIETLEPNSISNIDVDKLAVKNKLAEVRDICNAFDEEMQRYMQECRLKQQS